MDDFETMKRMTDEYMEAEASADLDRAISEWKRVETENVQLRAKSDEDDAVIKRLTLENMRLRSELKEALDEWEYCSAYKGEYLQQKHRDLEEIAKVRERHGLNAQEAPETR